MRCFVLLLIACGISVAMVWNALAAPLGIHGQAARASNLASSSPTGKEDPAYKALWLYRGTWEVKKTNAAAGTPADRLTDDCSLIGKYFACQQTINGKIGALIIFVPAEKSGHYYTQGVAPDGLAGGRGELDISGERWTYSSKSEQDGKTTFYRTTNLFTGNDKIHYEVAESSDGEHWTTKQSGDEVRVHP